MFHPNFGVFDDLKGNKDCFIFNPEIQCYTFLKSKNEQFLYKKIKGDFILRAHIESNGKAIIGFKICDQFNEKITHAVGEYTKLNVLEIERKGTIYRMSTAQFGKPFSSTKIITSKLQNEVLVALFLQENNEAEKNSSYKC